MKKFFCIVLVVIAFCITLSGCGDSYNAKKYVEIINQYCEEKYNFTLEKGQDTYIKIIDDAEKNIEAYGYTDEGLMFVFHDGAMDAYNRGESVLKYVNTQFPGKPNYKPPTKNELQTEWIKVKP